MTKIEPTTDHPVPFDLSDELPQTHKDAVAIAANTADLISELGGTLDFNEADGKRALDLVKNSNPPSKPKHVQSSAEAMVLAHAVKKYDFQAFADVQQARNFITNKLLTLADCGDAKLELKALELLGKHSDIGLFTERSEVTVHHTTADSLEKSIKERIKRLLNADVVDVMPTADDLDEELTHIHDENKAEPELTPEEAFIKTEEPEKDGSSS